MDFRRRSYWDTITFTRNCRTAAIKILAITIFRKSPNHIMTFNSQKIYIKDSKVNNFVLDLSYDFLSPMGFPENSSRNITFTRFSSLPSPFSSFHIAQSRANMKKVNENIQLFQHIQLATYILRISSKKHQLNGKLFIKLNFYFLFIRFFIKSRHKTTFSRLLHYSTIHSAIHSHPPNEYDDAPSTMSRPLPPSLRSATTTVLLIMSHFFHFVHMGIHCDYTT